MFSFWRADSVSVGLWPFGKSIGKPVIASAYDKQTLGSLLSSVYGRFFAKHMTCSQKMQYSRERKRKQNLVYINV
jgi:hypothetical protein